MNSRRAGIEKYSSYNIIKNNNVPGKYSNYGILLIGNGNHISSNKIIAKYRYFIKWTYNNIWKNTISKVKSGILVERHKNSLSYNKITFNSWDMIISGNKNDILPNRVKSKINSIISFGN